MPLALPNAHVQNLMSEMFVKWHMLHIYIYSATPKLDWKRVGIAQSNRVPFYFHWTNEKNYNQEKPTHGNHFFSCLTKGMENEF